MLLRRRIEDLPTGTKVGHYTVHKRVGEGSSAIVYQVTHRALGSVHAMKVLSEAGMDARRRLQREGMVAAMLRHRHVVSVTDLVVVGGTPSLIQEYVSGPTLAEWLKGGRPPFDEAERVFRGIVDGVAHAHERGVVHGDLKPSNVLLAPEREGLEPRITDFGLHRLLAEPELPCGHGTAEYAAPEQLRRPTALAPTSDVFSLGCILYELLSGRPTFRARSVPELYLQMSRGSYEALPKGVPAHLEALVHACLRPEPSERPQDALVLLGRLRRRLPTAIPGLDIAL